MTLALIPDNNEMTALQFIAKQAMNSGLYNGVGGEAKIFMVLMAARELGIAPMAALNGGLWNIQGKIEISARLMNAMIRRAGHSITIKVSNEKECVLIGKRADNGDSFETRFSIEDAAKAGLANRPVWKAYAEDMLYSRAMSRLARRLFSDVIGTAYVEGEISDSKEFKPENLPVAETEEIKSEEPKIELVNAEQALHLAELYSQIDDHAKEKNKEYMIKSLGAFDFALLPADKFNAFAQNMRNNIEKNKAKL